MARRDAQAPSLEPLPTGEEKTRRVRAMFDAIAPRYDLINRLMTFGLDQSWRRTTVDALALPPGAVVLDLACGTGDLSRIAARRGYRVVGSDLSAGMLAANRAGTPLAEADVNDLPFADASFDGVVCGYALRNFTDLAAAFEETARILRPGGRLAVLEVDAPTSRSLRLGYDVWFTRVVPVLGAALSDRDAYAYLPRSVAYLPAPPVLRSLLIESGYATVGIRPLAGGLSQLIMATRAGRTVTDPLHARTVPLDYGPDALQFDGSPTVLFDRPGLTLVGWGTAQLVEAAHAAEQLAAIPCDDTVGRTGSGVVALGALPFLAPLSGVVIVPRFTMGIATDPDGSVHRWVTAVGPSDHPLPSTEELFDAVIWQYGPAPEAATPPGAVTVTTIDPILSSEDYGALVAGAVEAMGRPDATLVKVVLSRAIEVGLSNALLLSDVLRRMRADEPNCTVFSLPVPDGTFFGASPELLIARRGNRITSHPLAGTVARGDTARRDADAQGRLAASVKDHEEHRYVIDEIVNVLRPLCHTLQVPAQPSLVAFRSVAHLGTRLEGELSSPLSVLDILERLHPTPAVGGSPTADALAYIAEHEPSPRGYWAGPLGWVDADGNGEWMLGLRSARLHPDGDRLTLQAGAGLVYSSQPDDEEAEVNVKLTTVLDTVVRVVQRDCADLTGVSFNG